MGTSVLTRQGVQYPDSHDHFSPDMSYPEYVGGHLASAPNAVYEMVRSLLAQAGLDTEHFGTPEWNPLGKYIRTGASVFVLCNFVYQRRSRETEQDFFSKCTHGSVLRAVIDYVLLATGPTGHVCFGNSPLQSCKWKQVLSDTGADRVEQYYQERNKNVRAVDLRLHVAERNSLGKVIHVERRSSEGSAVEVRLNGDSLLEQLEHAGPTGPRFRISDYNPDRLASFHEKGIHRYIIGKAVLEADTILCLPKLKTHEKVGITCSLKGYVGMVGHKDCLAHHRFGGPSAGGDEFPAGGWLLVPLAHFHDWMNRRPTDAPLQGLFQIFERGVRKLARMAGMIMSGAWSGNDTAWRMSLDLARIAHFADTHGKLRNDPQRTNIALIDGIVAGEGEGPLTPSPVQAGTLVFSGDVVLGDRIACRLMGFDPGRIRLVDEAADQVSTRERMISTDSLELVLNGRQTAEGDVPPVLGRKFLSPKGWRQVL